MLYDRLAGLPLEYDAKYGAVVRAGRRHGIPTPLHEAFVALLGAISDAPPAASPDPAAAVSPQRRAMHADRSSDCGQVAAHRRSSGRTWTGNAGSLRS